MNLFLHSGRKSGILFLYYDLKRKQGGIPLKDINLLVWLTQLGISVAAPLVGFLWLGVWLHNDLGWGKWTVIAGLLLGLSGAFSGLRSSLQIIGQMSKEKKEDIPPPVAFNEHE